MNSDTETDYPHILTCCAKSVEHPPSQSSPSTCALSAGPVRVRVAEAAPVGRTPQQHLIVLLSIGALADIFSHSLCVGALSEFVDLFDHSLRIRTASEFAPFVDKPSKHGITFPDGKVIGVGGFLTPGFLPWCPQNSESPTLGRWG